MSIRIKTNTISPSLKRALAKAKNQMPALRAAAEVVVQMAKRSFNEADLRAADWSALAPETLKRKARAGLSSGILQEHGTLKRSPRVLSVTARSAKVGSDRAAGSHSLAAIHQLGAPKAGIPARPFFPFRADGTPTAKCVRNVEGAIRRKLGL